MRFAAPAALLVLLAAFPSAGLDLTIDDFEVGPFVLIDDPVSSTESRSELANLYEPGQEIWRTELTHFTPLDLNWPMGFPDSADGTNADGVKCSNPDGCPTRKQGSIIEVETQVLGETIALADVPHALHYRSNRVPGYEAARTIRIPITDAEPPASLNGVEVTVDVAGKRTSLSFPPTASQPLHSFTWDGLDAYDRPVNGTAKGTVRIGYVYDAIYQEPSEFARNFGRPGSLQPEFTITSTRPVGTLWREFDTVFGALDARAWGVGGWTLSAHHFYDPDGRVLYRGDGVRRNALGVNRILRHLAGGLQSSSPSGVPGPAEDALFGGIADVAAAADGSLYVADQSQSVIYRIDSAGQIDFVTSPTGSPAEQGWAHSTRVTQPSALALRSDGMVYVQNGNRIQRINPAGYMVTIAGNGSGCLGGLPDGAIATQVGICVGDTGLEVGPDGSVYFMNFGRHIVQVKPDQTLETIVGDPAYTSGVADEGVGKPAREWRGRMYAFTMDDEGTIFFTAEQPGGYGQAVYRVRPGDTAVEIVAGGGSPPDGIGDGGPATEANFSMLLDSIAVGPNGGIYVPDDKPGSEYAGRVRYFQPGGDIRTIAGNGEAGTDENGIAATQAPMGRIRALETAPDGTLVIGERSASTPLIVQLRTVAPSLPTRGPDEITIASADGRELFDFDDEGRHLRTRHPLTGADLRSFGYDSAGRLVEIREIAPSGNSADDRVTTVERDTAGEPTAIVGPYGARTDLAVDGNGFLASVSNPLNETHLLTHSAAGLLESFTPPAGGSHTFAYDEQGYLIRDDDPLGGFTELTRNPIGDDYEVVTESALGRVTSVEVVEDIAAPQQREWTDEAGFTRVLEEAPGEFSVLLTADGTETRTVLGADPRLGLEVALAAEHAVTTPSMLERVRTQERTASIDTNGDLLSQVDTIDVNGAVATRSFDAATLTTTTATPEARLVFETIDDQGRLVGSEVDGLEPVTLTYDDRGRPESVSQGQGAAERLTEFTFDADGRLASVTDPLLRVESYEYDDAGRLFRTTLPDSRVVVYGYDANGNLTSLTPPGQPAHVFRYTLLDQEKEYDPPSVGAGDPRTFYTYDLDRQLKQIDRPDGGSIVMGYDTAGRVSTVTLPRGTVTHGYSATTGQLTSLTAPGGEGLAFTHDGMLPTGTDVPPLTGPINLQVPPRILWA